jgi:hypothetical protein
MMQLDPGPLDQGDISRGVVCAPYSFARVGTMAGPAPIYWFDPFAREPLVAFEEAVQDYSVLPSEVQRNAREMVLGFVSRGEAEAMADALAQMGVPTRLGVLSLPLYMAKPNGGAIFLPTALRVRAAADRSHVIRLSDLIPDWHGRVIWGLPAETAAA